MKNYDVIVVGAGVSGLYTAINLPQNMSILVVSKRDLLLCNSALAQGGIAGVYKSPEDNVQLHINDTLIAGSFKNNPNSVRILANEAAIDIEKIIELGVEFDKTANGELHRTLEGGHSRNRIFHHKDCSGFEITEKLSIYASTLENVEILENTLLSDIKKTENGFSLELLKDGKFEICNCKYTVFATGGIGRVYDYTTNSAIATGDGISFAHKLGATIKNLSFIQFHPTAFSDKSHRECFLISESVRGEGAYLKNVNGERFMNRYDDRLELAPRDVVSNAIMTERELVGSDEFYLDITHVQEDVVKFRFPMIYDYLERNGINMAKDRIPIFPCQHYLMGGINVNSNAATSVDGLYAVGECSHTGVHGSNRLASNSLLEALVFSRKAAENIALKDTINPEFLPENLTPAEFENCENYDEIPQGLRTEIRHIMQNAYFVIPNQEEIANGFERISEIKNMLETGKFRKNCDYIEAKSLATVAYLVLREVL